MIFSSTKGSNIAGALRYVEGPGRDQVEGRATLLGGNGFGFDPDEKTVDIAKRLMVQNGSREFQGEKDKYCTKDCLHLSLSWDPKQAPPDLEEKRETARKFMRSLGMENSMHLIYEHNDKEHPHIHIVASRVDPETGRAYDSYRDVQKGLQCALEKEREDELSGRRPIPEAKRHLHEREPTLEDVQALYAARKQEQGQRYRAKQAVDGLYRAHEKERQMVDDGVGGRWAKDVPAQNPEKSRKKEWKEVARAAVDRVLYGNKLSEQVVDRAAKSYGIPKEERRFYYPKGELQKQKEERMAQESRVPDRLKPQDDTWLLAAQERWTAKEAQRERERKDETRHSLRQEDAANKLLENDQISQEEFNRVTTRERKEPKRSIIERITERAPKVEQTQAIERERGLKL